MKCKKLIAAIIAATFVGILPVSAEVPSTPDNLTSTFYATDYAYPSSVIKVINNRDAYKSQNGGPIAYGEAYTNKYNTNGGLYSYGYNQEPLKLDENEPFDSAIPYMCYGGEGFSSCGSDNRINVDLAMAEQADEGDGIMLSFYYRSLPEFNGAGTHESTTYTGETVRLEVCNNYTQTWKFQSNDLKSYRFDIVPDGTWKRVDMVYRLGVGEAISDQLMKVGLVFGDVSKACYIEFANFKTGVLKYTKESDSNAFNQMFTETSWHMMNPELSSISVGGTPIAMADGQYSYKIPAVFGDSVTAESKSGAKIDILQKSYNTYEITTYSAGYDPIKGSEDTVTFRTRYNNGSFSGNDSAPAKKNCDMTKTYTVVLDIPAIVSDIDIDGTPGNTLTSTSGGCTVSVNMTFSNLESREYNYKVLMILRKSGKIVSVIPFGVTIADNEPTHTDRYSYVLPAGDYTGVTVDYYAVDTGNYADAV